MIEVRLEGHIDGPCSDITLNGQDIRSKFEYTDVIRTRYAFENSKISDNKNTLYH